MMRSFPPGKIKLLFTDTDSLYYHIEDPDLEKRLSYMTSWFDRSEYPRGSKYYNADNRMEIGKFKCETNGAPISEFCGLMPKMYSYLYKESTDHESQAKEKLRIKGIYRAAGGNLRHQQYKAQLELPTENYITTRRIGSQLHKIY